MIGLAIKRACDSDSRPTSRIQSGRTASSGSQDLAQKILGNLGPTVGSGEHEKPILEAVLQGMRDLSMDVQDLKGALYHSWELERESEYITLGMQYKEQYSLDCREHKGKGVDLGHQKNYIFTGILMAMKQDKDLGPDGREPVNMLLNKLRDPAGKLSLARDKEICPLVAHCQVVRTKKKGFVNILLRGPEGNLVMQHLEKAFDRDGKRQWDPTVPKPIHKDIKMAILDSKKRGR